MVQRSIVESLHEKNALRPGLGIASATDVLWTLNHPNVYQLLVPDRGWKPEQYERRALLTASRLGRASVKSQGRGLTRS